MQGYRTGTVVTIRGYTGSPGEMSFTPKGKAVTKFSVAVGGYQDEVTTWFSCFVWEEDRAREAQEKVDRKGLAVDVTGRLKIREFKGKRYYDVSVDKLYVEDGSGLNLVEVEIGDESRDVGNEGEVVTELEPEDVVEKV